MISIIYTLPLPSSVKLIATQIVPFAHIPIGRSLSYGLSQIIALATAANVLIYQDDGIEENMDFN